MTPEEKKAELRKLCKEQSRLYVNQLRILCLYELVYGEVYQPTDIMTQKLLIGLPLNDRDKLGICDHPSVEIVNYWFFGKRQYVRCTHCHKKIKKRNYED